MTALFTPEFISAVCFMAALAVVVRWRLTGSRTGMILLPSLLWLSLVYLGIATHWRNIHELIVRANYIRPALLLLIISILLVEFNCVRLWQHRK